MGFFKIGKKEEKPRPAPLKTQVGSITSLPGAGLPSPRGSRPPSVAGSSRSRRTTGRPGFFDEIRYDVMCNFLFQQQCAKMWIGDISSDCEGVLVRKSPGVYVASPPTIAGSVFAYGCETLNVQVAMTVSSRVVQTFLQYNAESGDIPLGNGLRVQILPSFEFLPRARKHQYAAVCAAEGLLVVWDDDANNIILRASDIIDELTRLIWDGSSMKDESDDIDEKKGPYVTETEYDDETGMPVPESRPTHIQNAVMVGLTLVLVMLMLGAGFRQVALEIAVDSNYLRLAFILMTPVQIFFSLFFSQIIITSLAQLVGPIRQMKTNSKYYSAIAPPRLRCAALPHLTIQCPVYKEGLEGVIMPTVKSIKQAMSTYELQGGSSNIFINDDGLQIISEEERQARIDFYTDNNIGWVARPKHGDNGFVRKGKFKKASNMNYGLMISSRVEEKLANIARSAEWSAADEAQAYGQCLVEVLEGEQGRAWADGNIRIGDYILLIDSDTRVPTDCFLDACSEMELSPEVGIMQFSSGVMQVVHTYFENGITFFTNLIYTAIRFAVSNGDVSPFVGHNAILRWSAIQQVSYIDEDGYDKYWSESHVSEDFDMSLRLQIEGYIIRLAAWAGAGFKEGVSLTVYDELARWEKYAYGCNELLFHPLRFWIIRGPFTPLFRKFLSAKIPLTSKVTITAYIGTYYAIGAAWLLTSINYFIVGWFNGYADKYYIDSWRVWFSVMIVFNCLGNVALAVMRYRVGEKSFFAAFFENMKWILMLVIFLGGISIHVSQALLSHMFEIDMSWGATSKEAEWSNFFVEVPRVCKRFKWTFAYVLVAVAAIIVLAEATFVPWQWRIDQFLPITPWAMLLACHFLLPIALNPALMTFSF